MNLSKPYIASATYLLEFARPVPKIRFEQGRAEEAFSAIAGSSSQQTNVPDALDPNIARIVFPGSRKVISISQARLQIDFSFESGGLAQQLEIVKKNTLEFHSAALKKFALEKYALGAVVLNIQIESQDEVIELYKTIRDKFLAAPKTDLEFASAQLSMGFKIDEYFVNLAADVFEERQFTAGPTAPGQMLYLKAGDGTLVSQGFTFKIETNNRPRSTSESAGRQDASVYFDILEKFMRDSFPRLSGIDLL